MPSVTLHQLFSDPPAASVPPPPEPPQAQMLREAEARLAPVQVVRRTGLRPYAFNGQLLGTVCGVDQVLPYWYEINVYRTVLGSYVSDIRLFGKAADAPDLFRAREHDDLDALHAYLEGYDPCGDLPPIRYDDSPATSAAALALRAIEVRAEMRRIDDHFRATVGALLNALAG